MRRLGALKGLILAINLVVAGAGALAVYSVMFALTVELPGQGDVKWYLEGEDVVFLATGRVINNGFYEVEDVGVDAFLSNQTGNPIVRSHVHYDNIPRGTTDVEFNLRFKVAMLAEYARMVFEDDTLSVKVSVTAKYLYGLIGFMAGYDYKEPWSALVKEVTVDQKNITSRYWGNSMTLEVPYHIRCSSLIDGLSAAARVKLYSANGDLIADNSTAITLKIDTRGVFELSMDRNWTLSLVTHSQTLKLRVYGFFAGQSGYIERWIDWGAPLDGMKTTTIINPPLYIMQYSFTNNASSTLDASVTLTVFDAGGNVIGSSSDRYSVVHGQFVQRSISIPSSDYYNAKKVEFKVMDFGTGMRYMEVLEK